jgi:hypothetical protein
MAQLQGVLNAVVMFMGGSSVDGDYLVLLRTAAILGIFIAVGSGYVKARGESAAIYVLMLALFYYGLFIPRVTVTIQDQSDGAGAPVQVANVPLGIAAFSSMTSHIGYWFTSRFETFFSLPDPTLNMSSHGLLGGYRAVRLAHSMQIQDPIVAQDVVYFMRDCINPEIVSNPTALTALLKSTTAWAEFTNQSLINPGRMVALSGSSTAIGCDSAYTTLGTRLGTEATAQKSVLAKLLSPNLSQAAANTAIDSLLPGAEGIIFNASQAAADSIKQRMVINALNSTSATMATVLNDPSSAMTAYATAQAESSTNTAYKVMANLARETLPLVHNTLEAVVLSVFPFLMLLIVLAGENGGAVLKSYVMTMMWVQLWAPLYAVINYIGTMGAAPTINAAANGLAGVAISNAASIFDATISTEAVAGMLTMAVPMIAYALVRGGEVAASSLAGQVTAVAQQSSGRAGEAAGSGNISAGNVSWGNLNANNTKANGYSTDADVRAGAASVRNSQGDVNTFGGEGWTSSKQNKNDLAVTSTAVASRGVQLEQAASDQIQRSADSMKAVAQGASENFGLTTGRQTTGGKVNTGTDSKDHRESGSLGDGTTNQVGDGVKVSRDAGTSRRNTGALDTTMSGGLKLAGSAGRGEAVQTGGSKGATTGGANAVKRDAKASVSAGAEVGGGAKILQQYAAEAHKSMADGKWNDAGNKIDKMQRHLEEVGKSHGWTTATSGGDTSDHGARANWQRSMQMVDEARTSLHKAQQYSESAKTLTAASSSIGYDRLADAGVTSPAQAAHIRDLARNADTPEKMMELAATLSHPDYGRLPGAHMGGAPTMNREQIEAGAKQDMADPKFDQNLAKEQYRKDAAATGAGPTGLGVPIDKVGDVDGKIQEIKQSNAENFSEAGGRLGTAQRYVEGNMGFRTGPDSTDMTNYNSTATVAAADQMQDFAISAKQLVGLEPSGEQFRENAGAGETLQFKPQAQRAWGNKTGGDGNKKN